jgi:hypothetical protein
MQPPLRQPIAFWASRCADALVARTRGALAEIGVTQPEWWVLHQLSLHPEGMARTDVIDTVGPNDTPEAVVAAIASADENQWLVEDQGRLRSTPLGVEVFTRAADVQADLERERRQGITDDDLVTTITVLQRTIANVGGDAWHW